MAQIDPPDFARSCVVVAHPDDEILWFSSILDRVSHATWCFEDCEDYPELGPGRRAVLRAYPLPQVRSLGLPEPCSVHLVDWSQPAFSAYGLRLNAAAATESRIEGYRMSFAAIRSALATQLRGTSAVFTHNPWGEYGHADHVQVARVVHSLHAELGYRVFYSGYVAPRTMPLAAAELARFGNWFELPTQPALCERVQALYRTHGCWTWPNDYQRFATETFLEACDEPGKAGSGFRLNCVVP